MLWRDPGAVEKLDFAAGPGGPGLRPRAPFRFVRDMTGGTSPKFEARDARGVVWRVKLGSESRPDAFSSRIAWACGYYADPIHFIAGGHVAGKGDFRSAVFETTARPLRYLRGESWTWTENPFAGTRQLNGLKILIMLVSNWDNKDTRDLHPTGSNVGKLLDTRRKATVYYINDWGESMGRWGRHDLTRSRWNCAGFTGQNPEFVQGIRDGQVRFGFAGHHTDDFKAAITVEDVRWLLRYLGRITDGQFRAGLLACGASPDEAACFTRALRDRVTQLQLVLRGSGRIQPSAGIFSAAALPSRIQSGTPMPR